MHDLLRAIKTRIPEYQVFLIDACRVPDAAANPALGTLRVGRSCLQERSLADRGGRAAKQSINYAASELSPAFGRTKGDKGGLSLCTEALLQAPRGGG